jgi:hypothetical protein
VKHIKRKQTVVSEGKWEAGELPPTVIPIPNPPPTKVKIPIRLHAKIKETREPVVGLGRVSVGSSNALSSAVKKLNLDIFSPDNIFPGTIAVDIV